MKNYDIAIYPNENRYAGLGGTELSTEKYVLAAASDHPLCEKPIISPKDLAGQDIVYLKTNNQPEYSYHICKALDINYNSVSFTNTRQSQLQIISSGIAVGIIPENMGVGVNKDKITLIPFLNKNFSRKMMICFRKDKYLSPVASQFKDEVIAFFKLNK